MPREPRIKLEKRVKSAKIGRIDSKSERTWSAFLFKALYALRALSYEALYRKSTLFLVVLPKSGRPAGQGQSMGYFS